MFINTSGHREAPLTYYMGVASWNIKKGPSRDLFFLFHAIGKFYIPSNRFSINYILNFE